MVKIKIIFFLVFCSFRLLSVSQIVDATSNYIHEEAEEIIMVVESHPEYLGGLSELIKFIKTNLEYPTDTVLLKKITVYVQFYIDEKGETFGHRVLNSCENYFDEEALRVAKLIKFDKPAMQRGKPVIMRFILPFTFGETETKKENKRKIKR